MKTRNPKTKGRNTIAEFLSNQKTKKKPKKAKKELIKKLLEFLLHFLKLHKQKVEDKKVSWLIK